MKKIVLFIMFLFISHPAFAVITQIAGAGVGAATNPKTLTITAPTSPDNVLILLYETANNISITSVGSTGATWRTVADAASGDVDKRSEIWSASSAGTGTTITVNFSGTPSGNFYVFEYAGITNKVIAAAAAQGSVTVTVLNVPTLTTTINNALLIGIGRSRFGNCTAGPTDGYSENLGPYSGAEYRPILFGTVPRLNAPTYTGCPNGITWSFSHVAYTGKVEKVLRGAGSDSVFNNIVMQP